MATKPFWLTDSIALPREFDWSVTPTDPNDKFFGQLVSSGPGDFEKSTHVLFGAPFDGAVLGRKGALNGPRAIRKAFQTLKAGRCSGGEPRARVFDFGDIVIPRHNVNEAHSRVEQFAAAVARTATISVGKQTCISRRVIALGGDHSLTFPLAKTYLKLHEKNLAIINLDAHLDVRETPEGHSPNSGTSFRRLIEAGLNSYTVIGARDFQTSPKYFQYVRDCGGQIVSADDVHREGCLKIVQTAIRNLPADCKSIYLSVDLDVADASVAPGVSAPTPGGLFAHQVFELIRTICADPRVHACDIMECAPNLEEPNSDRTARLGAACLAEMIAVPSPLGGEGPASAARRG